jgi:DNA invertase Pin-like site-specific DNA recombinase
MPTNFAYLRVSTIKQDLENQRSEIEGYASRNSFNIDRWIRLETSSRKSLEERGINALIEGLRRNDRVIVSELSRLARSLREIHNIVHSISLRRAELHVVKQNLVTRHADDMTTKIVLNSFAMAAEIERDLISLRTRNALARIKAEGRSLGNPNLAYDNKKRSDAADQRAENLRSTIVAFLREGYNQREIVCHLNQIGVRTVHGRPFRLTTLQRVLKRLNLCTPATTYPKASPLDQLVSPGD